MTMGNRRLTLFALLAVAPWPGLANAEEAQETDRPAATAEERQARRDAMRERWQNMSEEEREAFRAEMRAKRSAGDERMPRRFRHLSDEEREAMRERWQNMSEEERQALREQIRERRRAHRQKDTPGA